MAIVVSIYDSYHEQLLKGSIAWLIDTIEASLHIGEVFAATESNFTQIIAEIGDADYLPVVLTNLSVAAAANILTVDSPDDINYGSAVTIAAAQIVIRKDTGVPANDILFFHIDLDGTKSSTSGVFKYTFHANGINRLGVNGFT